MECNKEEALRARDIALKKMETKDFIGARKFALKAQQLYREVENISQMICVCDVHCSAESKMIGKDLDWYGILQIEQTADDVTIKKQYRKFALLLHPDKNKFAGAEAAFKLIGEAQRVLLDKDVRSLYDMRCKASFNFVKQNQPAQHSSRNVNVAKTSRVPNSVSGRPNFTNQHPNQQAQQGAAANGKGTFWTQCPFCLVRYQYFKEVLNRALRCQGCKKPFIAYDIVASGARPGSETTQPVFNGKTFSNVFGSKTGSEAVNKQASNVAFQSKQNPETSRSQEARQPHKSPTKVEQVSKSSGQKISKRGKKYVVESSESFGSDSSSESEEEIQTDFKQQMNSDGDRSTRRSSRNKRHVSYNENLSDDEQIVNPSKKAKDTGQCGPTTEVDASEQGHQPFVSASASASRKESNRGECKKSNGSETVVESAKKSFEADVDYMSESSHETTPEPELFDVPDPDFSDFDKLREEQCFRIGQMWAVYDTTDAMPRFYAMIRKIYARGFKLRITWLESNPDDPLGIDWVKAELPFGCGKFKYGSSEDTEDRLMFSHEVYWENGGGRNSVLIYPRKGETWALFKNWDANTYSISDNADVFEYEFVEVLSDYDDSIGIRVSQLVKLKGFASLFCRRSATEIQIPPVEVLRFSHRVPSCQMSGNEREDVPKGSFELDPAAITRNLEEFSVLGSNGDANSVNLAAKDELDPTVKVAEKVHGNNLNGDVNHQNVSNPEFFNFDDNKSLKKFQKDQVWAIYSDVDGLPKTYGIIKKIDHEPHFKVQLAYMDVCNLPDNIPLWKEKEMPISCGRFKIKSKTQTYAGNRHFSHQVRAQSTGKNNVFAIYPHKGDVWALYKNWNDTMKVVDLQNCDYDIVEILDENDSHIKVMVLERVHNFNSVFKPQKTGDSPCTREISQNELLRFSHQIPSFRLTVERGGSLRGYWELDPAAFPKHVLYK